MGRFETPTTNQNLASKLQGLDLQAVTIAQSQELTDKLDDFVATYVTPETLGYDVNGSAHSYQYRRISALGRAGTLLHARMHAYPLIDVDPNVRNLVIVDSIDSSKPEEFWLARSIEASAMPGHSAETILEMGSALATEAGLRPVPDDMTEGEWEEQQELARIIERETQRANTPQVRFGNGSWTFRHENGMLEPLQDVLALQQNVRLAVARGLGSAAVVPIQSPAVYEIKSTGLMSN